MKVLLWIAQAVLALLAIAGGAYKIFAFAELAKMPATAALPHALWTAAGVFEVLCGILLLVPSRGRTWRFAPIGAIALVLESLALAAVYSRYSLQFAATNPLVWVILMAVLGVFVAWGRWGLADR